METLVKLSKAETNNITKKQAHVSDKGMEPQVIGAHSVPRFRTLVQLPALVRGTQLVLLSQLQLTDVEGSQKWLLLWPSHLHDDILMQAREARLSEMPKPKMMMMGVRMCVSKCMMISSWSMYFISS